MIVRWSLADLRDTLAEVAIKRPYVIASERWRALDLPENAGWWSEVPSDSPEVPPEADGILAVGGGSAIDMGKYASAQSGLPVVHVPTTYSGAEWTTFYGIRSPDRRIKGGGAGATPVAIVYDVELTLDLPQSQSAGTAMNALAHCAEALYVEGHNGNADVQALAGTRIIAAALPGVVADGRDRDAREELLKGAMHAGRALSLSGLALGHAMAQALGGRFGTPHGAMNALCLPPALEFNRAHAPEAVRRFGAALRGDAVERARELAQLGGFNRLRDEGIPEDELGDVAAAASERAGNLANPRPASPEEIEEMLRSIW
jgi:alcohol dehydrogenase class IV